MSKRRKRGNGIKKFFEEGKLSKMKGLMLEDNPYEVEDIEAAYAWERGWNSVEDIQEDIQGC
jgi:hypothetical protein